MSRPYWAKWIDLYQPAAEAAAIVLRLRPDIHAKVHADSRRLLLILGNLVDNALRLAPRQAGRSNGAARRTADTVQIEVQDQGPGSAHRGTDAGVRAVLSRRRRSGRWQWTGSGHGRESGEGTGAAMSGCATATIAAGWWRASPLPLIN